MTYDSRQDAAIGWGDYEFAWIDMYIYVVVGGGVAAKSGGILAVCILLPEAI